jgi:Abnormal spindle-like microcephaly-assoc'd, ASPM-SPD-2-Hydin
VTIFGRQCDWAKVIPVVLLPLLFAGCQILTGNPSPGNSASVTSSPTTLAFGNAQVGSHASLSETVKNTGGSTVTISSASVGNAAYSISGLTLPASVAAGQSIAFTVKFAPSAAGTASGNLILVSDAANSPLTVPLSGTGVTAVTAGDLSANPTSLAFGNVQVGSHASLSGTVTNTGGSTVTISSASVGNAAYSISGLTLPASVAAGQSIAFMVKFAPSAAGAASGNLSLVSDAANSPLSIPLSGTGVTPGDLSANPTSLAFGNVQVGSNASLSETVTNTGGSTVTISSASVGNAAYSINGLTLPTDLSAGQSVTFNVTFAPGTATSITANLTLVSNAGNSPLVIASSGTGTARGQLGVSPASLSFGDVVVGTSSTLSSSLSATGAAVTVSSATSTSPEFTISGLSLPAVLSAGQSLPYSVTFTPQTSGTATATLTFVSNASNSPTHQTASGNGTPPPQHSVGLSWNASSSQDVVGYNVYRGGVSGGPYSKINTSLDASTNYADNQVVAGQTYYYVTTAVDGNSVESGHSNEAQAVIPQP